MCPFYAADYAKTSITWRKEKIENHGSFPVWNMPEGSSIKQENAVPRLRKI